MNENEVTGNREEEAMTENGGARRRRRGVLGMVGYVGAWTDVASLLYCFSEASIDAIAFSALASIAGIWFTFMLFSCSCACFTICLVCVRAFVSDSLRPACPSPKE